MNESLGIFELRSRAAQKTEFAVHDTETGIFIGKIRSTETHQGRPWEAVGQFCSRMDACCALRGSMLFPSRRS